ncbi:MAG: hypothetical protein J6A25_02595 [Lachnospiraceae bacterium]|nr:hypothetical protein [Lachnospiraceae bacterium]
MNENFMQLISQTGIWCVTAYILGKNFFDYVTRREENDRVNFKEREERMYQIIEKQEVIMIQQKDLLTQSITMSRHNKEMLDKLTNIQMLHTNRLDRIEDRQTQLEEEIKKIGSKL